MYDLSKAEKIYHNGIHIGYIFKLADDQWVPLNKDGKNYTGPTYKKDAQDIVLSFYGNKI